MGWISDFLAGYSHGKIMDGFERLGKKLEGIEKKIDSKSCTSNPCSTNKPSHSPYGRADRKLNKSTHDVLLKRAHEALARGNTEEYHKILRDLEDFDRRHTRY